MKRGVIIRRSTALVAALVTVVVQLALFPVAANADQWAPTFPVAGTSQVAVAVTDQNTSPTFSMIIGTAPGTTGAPFSGNEAICTSLTSSGPCDFRAPGDMASGTILLPACADATQTNCVASVSIGTSAATLEPATFIRTTLGPTFPGIPAAGMPEGAGVGLWQSPVADAVGTTTYAADVALNYGPGVNDVPSVTLSAQIQPYSQVSGTYSAPAPVVVTNSSGVQKVEWSGSESSCAWTETGTCGLREDFTAGTFASMSIRVTNLISGWFFGRLQSPSMSVQTFDASSRLLTVAGEAVAVPSFEATSPFPTLSPAFQTYFSSNPYSVPLFSGLLDEILPNWPVAFDAIDDLRSAANDTATGVTNIWTINSYAAGANPCVSDSSKISGLVTTNAMAYDGSVPAFANGFFTYHVAGMHYQPDGSVMAGTYDMIMADSVARCLYGFTKAPISATIAVTENSGIENYATTTVSDVGGWLHLGAYNFNFSNPVITMHLKQASPKRTAKPSALTCAKGSSKVTVRGVTPRCPAGYKVHG